jgi:hypothetical protein
VNTRIHRRAVRAIRIAVTIIVLVTGIALAVPIGIHLTRVQSRRAVVIASLRLTADTRVISRDPRPVSIRRYSVALIVHAQASSHVAQVLSCRISIIAVTARPAAAIVAAALSIAAWTANTLSRQTDMTLGARWARRGLDTNTILAFIPFPTRRLAVLLVHVVDTHV